MQYYFEVLLKPETVAYAAVEVVQYPWRRRIIWTSVIESIALNIQWK